MIVVLFIVFTGRGSPVESSPGFVSSAADGKVLWMTDPRPGGAAAVLAGAAFKTLVYAPPGGGKFHEAGRVEFPGTPHFLVVDTPEPGTVREAPDGVSSGAVIWRIRSGGGGFQGAGGLVTGNFTGAADGTFTDHHVYRIVLPE